MMKASLLLVVVLACVAVRAQVEVLLKAFPHADVDALYNITEELPMPSNYMGAVPVSPTFACPTLPAPAETNDVRKLKPGHIRVVMGMGDSITAAMSAKDTNILSLKEYRGLSYAIGADAGVNTLPNLLKPFVPTGFPLGSSTGIGSRTSAGNGLNAAVSGAINNDMLGQAQWLVTQLKANTKININTDWKVLTIWIGSNNLCAVCSNAAANNGANFEAQVIAALNYLQTNVPRLFVNLVGNLDISDLYKINTGTCGVIHSTVCSCVGSSDAAKRAAVSTAAKDYVTRAKAIAANYNSKNSTTFAVVVQPFLTNNLITERNLLSAADCFHPSAYAHGLAAVALWNNMLTVAAKKQSHWDPVEIPICPTAESIFPLN